MSELSIPKLPSLSMPSQLFSAMMAGLSVLLGSMPFMPDSRRTDCREPYLPSPRASQIAEKSATSSSRPQRNFYPYKNIDVNSNAFINGQFHFILSFIQFRALVGGTPRKDELLFNHYVP